MFKFLDFSLVKKIKIPLQTLLLTDIVFKKLINCLYNFSLYKTFKAYRNFLAYKFKLYKA